MLGPVVEARPVGIAGARFCFCFLLSVSCGAPPIAASSGAPTETRAQ